MKNFDLNRLWHKIINARLLSLILISTVLLPGQAAANPPSGDYSPDLSLNLRNKTVKEFLAEVEKKSEFAFFYFETDVDVDRRITLSVTNKKIEEILDQIFESTTTGYSIRDRQIYLSKKTAPAADQPDRTKRITGRVSDAEGNPLAGATVIIRNSQNATVTNLDGLYVIDARDRDYLVFSYIGYLRQEIPVGGRDVVNAVLDQDTQNIQDVVVIGYGKQEKASVVSSVASIGTTELSAPTANLTNNLAGQLAGLISIQRSAEPGRDDAEFWIRGISTFAGGKSPLVLVDGVPRSMSNIEADEIESFTLLKDAAATAVYGAEGANGVILITTKRGRISAPQVSFRAEFSLSTPTRLPEFVDSWDYLELANEANFNDGRDPYVTQSEIEKYRQGVDNDLYPNSKWLDELLSKHTTNQRYTLSFRGGAERAKYFVSLGYFRQEGIFKDNPMDRYKGNLALQRYNVRSNIDLNVTKTTQLSVDIAGQYVNRQSPRRSVDEIFGFMLYTPPHLFPSIYSDGTLATYPREADNNNRNPYNMLMNEGYKREWNTKIQSNITVGQDLGMITPGLRATGKVSLDYDNNFSTERKYDPTTYHATGRDENDQLVFIVPHSGSPVLNSPTTGHSSLRKIYIEGSFNYQRTFAERHAVGGMLLYMQKENQGSSDIIAMRKQGLVGRATYAYDNRYFIEGNFGYTGSETFAKKHRFGFFPAVGLGYFISNERFYPEGLKNVLSKAKLRVSYGRTGNDEVNEGRYLYRATFSQSGGYFDQGMGDNSGGYNHLGGQGIYDLRFINNELQWEIENKSNFGVDLGLFNKIDITADYFYNHRYNILVARKTIPGVAGFHASPMENYGKVDNWGFDASMNAYHNFGPVRVSMRGTFTFARNKILENDELPQEYPWMGEIGRRVGAQRLYIAERLYTEDDFIRIQNHNGTYSYKLKPGLAIPSTGTDINYLGPGDIKFKDLNGDGVIDLFDMTRDIGYAYTPEINYGFGLNVDFKGIYVSVFFQGTANTSMLLASGNDTFFPFNWGVEKSSYRKAFLNNRWTADNPRQDVLMPRLHIGYGNNINRESSTWWLRDGSFLRLKNVEIGYNLPKEVAKKILMSQARVYVMGYNLAVWDKLKMWDPELGNSNKGNGYPLQRTFTFGLEVTF